MIGANEVDALVAADNCEFTTLQAIAAELPEDRLRDFIRALERAHDAAVRDLSSRHGGVPYSGMGGLLADEVDE